MSYENTSLLKVLIFQSIVIRKNFSSLLAFSHCSKTMEKPAKYRKDMQPTKPSKCEWCGCLRFDGESSYITKEEEKNGRSRHCSERTSLEQKHREKPKKKKLLCTCGDVDCPFNVGQEILQGLDSPLFDEHRFYARLEKLSRIKQLKRKDKDEKLFRNSDRCQYVSASNSQPECVEATRTYCVICKAWIREPSSSSSSRIRAPPVPTLINYYKEIHHRLCQETKAAGKSSSSKSSKSKAVTARNADELRKSVQAEIEKQEDRGKFQLDSDSIKGDSEAETRTLILSRNQNKDQQSEKYVENSAKSQLQKASSNDLFHVTVDELVRVKIINPMTRYMQRVYLNAKLYDMEVMDELYEMSEKIRKIYKQEDQ
ncbi:uncharacterized protein LOC108105326 [Drosophila eugracilis]|uniref:uncharacterized protein LOC108105326 n=1 Tax=Drosophila eugracilis TaxID=29029 RepID=UPI0007E6E1BB|nr:uncharacterized protein LOC108105326 [Drosophila eugracilis]